MQHWLICSKASDLKMDTFLDRQLSEKMSNTSLFLNKLAIFWQPSKNLDNSSILILIENPLLTQIIEKNKHANGIPKNRSAVTDAAFES